ncbi:MAG: ATP phosphoribosyltransferase regulatory subunit [Chloroflexi bacterium]|nr:ATP phosphoribosyltransferase regulatory subunit [Chloroflexota bacterium]
MRRLDGTRDRLGRDWARLNSLTVSLREFFSRQGYQPVDTPVLEPTDLFLKKSGGELASRLYAFTDLGGHGVSLRPEFTSSVIRAYVQAGVSPPVRWQYAGPVFRYEEGPDRPRQFTQVGAELIGDGSPRADAEVVGLACQGLAHLGLKALRLQVGHVGALTRLLAGFGLSERARWFLAGRAATLAVPTHRDLREEMARVGLYGRSAEVALPGGVSPGEAHHVVERLLAGMGGLVGSRDPEEIVTRYLARLEAADEPRRVDGALSFLEELVKLKGEPEPVLAGLRALVARYRGFGLDSGPEEELRELVALLSPEQVASAQVELNMGLARGLAYYTGMVFDVFAPGDGGRPLGGGGRYDGLVKALGGAEDTPALGFAYTLESVESRTKS